MRKLLLCISFILFIQIVNAQQNATTDDGRKVVLNTDGTWKYVDNNNSSNTNTSSSNNTNTGKTPECEEYEYGTIVITNNKDIDISIYFNGLQKLINNPEYGNRVGMNVKDKKIWRSKSEEFIIPAGETRKIYKVMVGAYTYSVMNTLHTQKIVNGDVDVPQCTEDMIEIN